MGIFPNKGESEQKYLKPPPCEWRMMFTISTMSAAPLKTKMEPENAHFVKEKTSSKPPCLGSMLVFQGVVHCRICTKPLRHLTPITFICPVGFYPMVEHRLVIHHLQDFADILSNIAQITFNSVHFTCRKAGGWGL